MAPVFWLEIFGVLTPKQLPVPHLTRGSEMDLVA